MLSPWRTSNRNLSTLLAPIPRLSERQLLPSQSWHLPSSPPLAFLWPPSCPLQVRQSQPSEFRPQMSSLQSLLSCPQQTRPNRLFLLSVCRGSPCLNPSPWCTILCAQHRHLPR